MYQESRSTYLTHVLGTRLRRGDVSKSVKYREYNFTKGFPRIEKNRGICSRTAPHPIIRYTTLERYMYGI